MKVGDKVWLVITKGGNYHDTQEDVIKWKGNGCFKLKKHHWRLFHNSGSVKGDGYFVSQLNFTVHFTNPSTNNHATN